MTFLDNTIADVTALEPELFKLLHLVKNNEEHTELFKNLFIEVGTTVKHSAWVIIYCMRDLKWPEVQAAVNDWFTEQGGRDRAPRLMGYISDLNRAYADTSWKDADFFFYHWNREHPGETWPCAGIETLEPGEIEPD
ncbi:hypothetical protein [Pseudomonas asplenii]|nr:hypothetical protein [Pseudomonas fuscovaginae]